MSDHADIKLDTMQPIRTRPPFTGLVGRVGSFLLDVLVLYLLGWVLNRTFRHTLVHFNPYFSWLAYGFAFLYFWICEGPLGRGRTTGKYVLNMHIVTADGGVPGWGAAARRALVKTAVLLGSIDPFTQTMIFPAAAAYDTGIALTVVKLLATSLGIALGLAISIHPWKRAWHDQWAGTFVTGDPTPAAFRDTLDTPPDPVTARRIAMNLRMSAIFFVVASAVMLYRPLAVQFKPEARVPFEQALELQNAAPIAGARICQAYYPNVRNKEYFLTQIAALRQATAARKETVPTTDSLRATALYDGESIYVQAIATDRMTTATATGPAMLQDADRLRARAWQTWRQEETKTPTGLTARSFRLLLIEPYQFLLYHDHAMPTVIEGPADPAAGPLTTRDLTPPPTPQPTHETGTPQPTATK